MEIVTVTFFVFVSAILCGIMIVIEEVGGRIARALERANELKEKEVRKK